jgi:hypothetical protein
LGDLAKFVLVRHPEKENAIRMSIDPMDIIFGYTLRFKIEVMFKQAIHRFVFEFYFS